jgi:hypothetical protein
MSSQKKIVKANGAAPDDLEDKVAAELLNLEVSKARAAISGCWVWVWPSGGQENRSGKR